MPSALFNDTFLTAVALMVEIGVSCALVYAYIRMPERRMRLVVMLGTLTPCILCYFVIAANYAQNPKDAENRFAFFAMPVMAFLPYLALLGLGLCLSQLPRPIHHGARYGVGFAAASASTILLLILGRT